MSDGAMDDGTRGSEWALELLRVADASGDAERVAAVAAEAQETLMILSQVLKRAARWYADREQDLFVVGHGEADARDLQRRCVAELHGSASDLACVGRRFLAATVHAERLASQASHRLDPGEAARAAASGRSVYVVRHVSYGVALSWDVSFTTDQDLACSDAASLADVLPIGDVAQVAPHRPADPLPAPALATFPGQLATSPPAP